MARGMANFTALDKAGSYYDINLQEIRDTLSEKVGADLADTEVNDFFKDASIDLLKAYSAFLKKAEKVGIILCEDD